MSLIALQNADADWSHARRELLLKEVVCFFKGCSVDLLSFEEARKSKHLSQNIDRGLQMIPLEKIRGSVGRSTDFSESFLPRRDFLKERWQNVDVAFQEGKTPPIDVYQVDDIYYVVDGNHRVSIAHQRGFTNIEAYVTEFILPGGIGDGDTIDKAIINAEQAAFLESAGPANATAAEAMAVTTAGCYRDLADQIETYRQGYENIWKRPMTYEEAFSAWYAEVYAPAVEAIHKHDMLAQFPDRTEADLFIWTWQNNQSLEDLTQEPPASAATE